MILRKIKKSIGVFLTMFAVISMVCLSVSSALALSLYISPTGNDTTGDGSVTSPWKTVGKARDYIRTNSLNINMTADITVYMRGGTYPITSTIVFTELDSGSNGYSIKFRNYFGETPVISGGLDLSGGWTLHDADKNIYKKTGVSLNFRQLYVNGIRGVRARSSADWDSLVSWDTTRRTIRVNSSEISNWGNFGEIEMVIQQRWTLTLLRMLSYKTRGDFADITFQPEEAGIVFDREYPPRVDGQPYYFENAYEFINFTGEWYIDTVTDTLYYKPRNSDDPSTMEVIAPQVEQLLTVIGTDLANQAHHIWFTGITLKHSTWMRTSNFGFMDLQATQYYVSYDGSAYVGRPPAAVYLKNANNLRFERNIFTLLGATAVDFHRGNEDDVFIGNVIYDVSGNGISAAVFADEDVTAGTVYNPPDILDITKNLLISNNFVSRIGLEYGGVAIVAGYSEGITIENNEVSELPYTGISVGWGWTSAASALKDNNTNNNYVHDYMKLLFDGGGIYTLSRQPNSFANDNYLRNQYGEFGAIYWDQGTQYYSMSNNVVENPFARTLQGSSESADNTLDWTYSTDNNFNDFGTNNTITNSQYYPNANWPTAALTIISNAGLQLAYVDIRSLVGPTKVDERDPAVTLTGTWGNGTGSNAYNGTAIWSDAYSSGATAEFTFSGTSIAWIGLKNIFSGKGDVYIDGVFDATVDTYSGTSLYQVVVYSKTGLSAGQHQIKIVSTAPGSNGYYHLYIDAFEFSL